MEKILIYMQHFPIGIKLHLAIKLHLVREGGLTNQATVEPSTAGNLNQSGG